MTLALWFASPSDAPDGGRAVRRARADAYAERKTAANATTFATPAFAARLHAGDPDAFDELFSATYRDLVRFAMRYIGSADGAEDIVMDVFYRVWDHCATWTPDDPVVYLFGAVRNRGRSIQRAAERHDASLGHLDTSPGMSVTEGIPDAAFEEGDRFAALARAVEALPDRPRMIFTLRRQHLTNAQVATILGVSIKTVERELTATLKVLRARLAPYTD